MKLPQQNINQSEPLVGDEDCQWNFGFIDLVPEVCRITSVK